MKESTSTQKNLYCCKSIRFPETLVKGIEEILSEENRSFSAFVVEASRAAVAELNGKK